MIAEEYIKSIHDIIDGMEKDGHLIDFEINILAGSIREHADEMTKRFEEIQNEDTRTNIDTGLDGLHESPPGKT